MFHAWQPRCGPRRALALPEGNAKMSSGTGGTGRSNPATALNAAALLWARRGEGSPEHAGLRALLRFIRARSDVEDVPLQKPGGDGTRTAAALREKEHQDTQRERHERCPPNHRHKGPD